MTALFPWIWYAVLVLVAVVVPGGTVAAYWLWRRKGNPMKRTGRKIDIAYFFKNGEVRAYDRHGFRIAEFDGSGEEAWATIKANVSPSVKLVEGADWNEQWRTT